MHTLAATTAPGMSVQSRRVSEKPFSSNLHHLLLLQLQLVLRVVVLVEFDLLQFDLLERHLFGGSHLIGGRRSASRVSRSAQLRFDAAHIDAETEADGQPDDGHTNAGDENVSQCVALNVNGGFGVAGCWRCAAGGWVRRCRRVVTVRWVLSVG